MRRCLRKTLLALSFSLASVGMVAALGEPVEPRADDIVQTNAIPTSSAKHDHAAERRPVEAGRGTAVGQANRR